MIFFLRTRLRALRTRAIMYLRCLVWLSSRVFIIFVLSWKLWPDFSGADLISGLPCRMSFGSWVCVPKVVLVSFVVRTACFMTGRAFKCLVPPSSQAYKQDLVVFALGAVLTQTCLFHSPSWNIHCTKHDRPRPVNTSLAYKVDMVDVLDFPEAVRCHFVRSLSMAMPSSLNKHFQPPVLVVQLTNINWLDLQRHFPKSVNWV